MNVSGQRAGPSAVERELREATAAMRRAIRGGEAVTAESVLKNHPDLASHEESAIELIYGEFAIRRELDQGPDSGDWLARFPRYRERLARLFDLHDIFGDFDGGPTPAPPAAPPPRPVEGSARRFGRFDLIEILGRGSEGIVYRAVDRESGRVMALKLILEGVHAASDDRRRLLAEAGACMKLRHPNIVEVYESGEVEGLPYLALEFVDGRTLARAIDGRAQPIERVVRLMIELAEAIDHFHRIGIIHRDLNPRNVLLTGLDDAVKVADFGLVKFLDEALTRTPSATLAGTPGYLAPEVALGRADLIGRASDVFSLGAILYEMLTGRAPFAGATPLESLQRTIAGEPVPPAGLRRGLPTALATIAWNCLDRDPTLRYATAAELADDLRRFRDGEPTRGRLTPAWVRLRRRAGRVSWRSAAAAAVAAMALAGLVAVRSGRRDLHDQIRATHARAERHAAEAASAQRIGDRLAYASDIRRAREQWDSGHHELALEIIDDVPTARRGFEWSYLDRLYHREVSLLRGHEREVRHLAVSPDGRGLASGDDEGVAILWDVPDRSMRARLRGPEGVVRGLAFAPDGSTLAVTTEVDGPSRGALTLWDAATGHIDAGPIPFPGAVDDLVVSPDGTALVVRERAADGSRRYHLVEWSPEGRQVLGVEAIGGPVAFAPDGRRVAWAGPSGEATLVDRATGRALWKSVHPGDARDRLAFSPDGSLLAGSGAGAVRWREAETGREVAALPIGGESRALAFAPGGRTLAARVEPGALALWDARTGRARPPAFVEPEDRGGFAFRRDGRTLAVGDLRPPTLWDVESGRRGRTFRHGEQTRSILALAFSGDDRTLVIGSEDRRIRLWDVDPGPEPAQVAGHPRETWSLAFSPDGRVLASGSDDDTIKLWNPSTGAELATLSGQDGTVASLAFSPDGASLAFARLGEEGTVGVWDVAGRRLAWSTPVHRGGARGVAFAPDGRSIVTGGSDGVVRAWDAADGRPLATLVGHAQAVRAVAYAPDGRTVASAGNGTTIRLWDVPTHVERSVLRGSDQYASLAFSPDGRHLAAANDVGNVDIWDLAAGRVERPLRGHKRGVRAVAYAPDGRTVATGGDDATVRLWDPITGQEFLNLAGHDGEVLALAFRPTGGLLASASFDGAIRLWHGR